MTGPYARTMKPKRVRGNQNEHTKHVGVCSPGLYSGESGV